MKEHVNMDHLKNKKINKTLNQIKTQDLYEILGLDGDITEVTEDKIKKAYKKLAILYHPDKFANQDYNEKEKERWLRVF